MRRTLYILGLAVFLSAGQVLAIELDSNSDGYIDDALIPPTIMRDSEAQGTDLSNTPAADSVQVNSSTGADTTLPAATPGNAGVMSAADKAKLDNIENNAAADQSAAEVPFTPEGSIQATNVQAAIQEVRDEAGGGGSVDLSSPGEIGATLPAPAHFTYLQCDSLDINPPPSGSTGELAIHEDPDSPGDDMVGFKAPTDVNLGYGQAGDLLWVLPFDDGALGQVMATDGSQTLSWITPLQAQNNLSDVPNPAVARISLDVPSNADLDTKQNSITGTCNVGETIHAINADGSVVCVLGNANALPAYSNDPCQAGFYSFDPVNHYTYMCVSANHWDYRDETGAWIIWDAPNPIVTINVEANTSYSLTDTRTIGQTWTIPAGGDGELHSVIFKAESVSNGGTVTCRASTSTGQLDLSNNYIEGSLDVTTAGEFEVVFSSTNTIAVGDVVSVACHISSGANITVSYQSSDAYAGGMKYTTGAVTWDLTGHEDSGQDFYFKYSRP